MSVREPFSCSAEFVAISRSSSRARSAETRQGEPVSNRLTAFAFLTACTTAVMAEAPPAYYKQLQRDAPEVLRIKILESVARCGETGCHYTVRARVVCVARSLGRLAPADIITIEYYSETASPQRPSPPSSATSRPAPAFPDQPASVPPGASARSATASEPPRPALPAVEPRPGPRPIKPIVVGGEYPAYLVAESGVSDRRQYRPAARGASFEDSAVAEQREVCRAL